MHVWLEFKRTRRRWINRTLRFFRTEIHSFFFLVGFSFSYVCCVCDLFLFFFFFFVLFVCLFVVWLEISSSLWLYSNVFITWILVCTADTHVLWACVSVCCASYGHDMQCIIIVTDVNLSSKICNIYVVYLKCISFILHVCECGRVYVFCLSGVLTVNSNSRHNIYG